MSSIIADCLKYTFASSGADSGTKEEDAIKSSFYSQTNYPSYWQITFSQPVTAGSYQICPNSPLGSYVSSWYVRYSTGTSLTFLQTDSVSSRPSGAVKFSFSKPISLKTLRITSKTTSNNNGQWLRVGLFDLFGTTTVKNVCPKAKSFQMNLRRIQQKIIRNAIILMMPLTTS